MIEVKVPELAESITEGTISGWLKNVGDSVERGEDIVELETDKVNVQISAENSGVLSEIKKGEGEDVEVGEVIATLDENAEAGSASGGGGDQAEAPAEEKKEEPAEEKKEASQQAEKQEQESKSEGGSSEGERPIATPAARKLARERGLDLSKVQTRDPMGRVHAEDVKAHEEKPSGGGQAQQQAAPQAKPAEQAEDPEKPVERVKMSRRRRTIAGKMLDVKNSTAMLTTFNEVDMSAVMALRKRRKDDFQKQHDVRLGFMSFFTKAVVGALKAYPLLNAEIDGNDLLLKKYYDIGIAVASDEGLVVPIVRNADRLGFAGIEQEIGNLAKKARDNSLGLNDLQGGSFTITNGGVFGSLFSTPIINAPQVGILGMHTIQNRPVAVTPDKMEIRPMMYIALSYDHRIVDGSEAVSFLAKIKAMIEDPETLLLEG
ncbi:MAG TPA: 2-oxoglutarate dehydrogenase complex dihydrolipoyllysine-residue succinyltransferase [Bacillales bacterium]|nr:2-oxoglutarate dehydrogenase complex dihydrolipoyllysine-residue succinyltransferase [Bacillales bacterium]